MLNFIKVSGILLVLSSFNDLLCMKCCKKNAIIIDNIEHNILHVKHEYNNVDYSSTKYNEIFYEKSTAPNAQDTLNTHLERISRLKLIAKNLYSEGSLENKDRQSNKDVFDKLENEDKNYVLSTATEIIYYNYINTTNQLSITEYQKCHQIIERFIQENPDFSTINSKYDIHKMKADIEDKMGYAFDPLDLS